MLQNLQVRNFAIIDEVDIEFHRGMTVLTGETGAGKSILVDALGLVLGERGGAGLVRDGAKRAEFNAQFGIAAHSAAQDWLQEQELDDDDECLVRRVVNADGRSRAFVNGNAVSLQNLKALGELLIDIHGQHFHQSLGKREVQRELLDHFGGLLALRGNTQAAFRTWQELAEQQASLDAALSELEARLELLEFQVGELDTLALDDGELDALMTERQKLQNAVRLAEGSTKILDQMYEGDGETAQSLVANACQSLQVLESYDSELSAPRQLLDEAGIQIAEASDQLRRYVDSLDADPSRRDWVEDRVHAIQTIARKHKIEPEHLGEVQDRLRTQLDELRNAEQRSGELREATESARQNYASLANELSAERKSAAASLSDAVTAAMAGLGMPGGSFAVAIEPREMESARANGLDNVEYRISANPGQPPMPLAKVASGGELSRMSLAIQVIASGGSQIPTMVFDEVDSGVGGGVAEMVGRRLRDLGESRQVLCVTHLPQVASQADAHVRIHKVTDGKTTRTGVNILREEERVEELARMLGGVKITRRTREHAAEMLATGSREQAAS